MLLLCLCLNWLDFLVDTLTPTLPLIKALQLYGWLGAPMKLLSFLGSETFFLLMLPLIYWNLDRRIGARLGVLLICGVLLNDLLKVAFALPRPFWTNGIGQLASKPELSFGFPSGHAQNTAALWTFVALQTKRPRLWVMLAVILLILVALSRLYLGAHFPFDVIGGALIGYGLLGVFLRAEKPVAQKFGHSLPLQLALIVGACVVVSALYLLATRRLVAPELTSAFVIETYARAISGVSFAARVGALLGLCGGLALASHFVPFEIAATRAQKLIRFVLGIVVLGAIYILTKKLPPNLPLAFAGYFLLTLWVTLLAPALFVRLRLMNVELRVQI